MSIGNKIFYLPQIDSTNDEAFRLIQQRKVINGDVVHAGFQTAGRGQQGNKWESLEGKNLITSIIFIPNFLAVDRQFLISQIVCLGIVDYLASLKIQAKIKWPNDIIVEDLKICGILIETAIMGPIFAQAVAGIGLNVNQDAFSTDAPKAVSMKMIKNEEFDIHQVLASLCKCIDKWYAKLEQKKYGEINSEYIYRLYLLDKEASFETEGKVFKGTIKGVDNVGRLELQANNELMYYAFKQIKFLY